MATKPLPGVWSDKRQDLPNTGAPNFDGRMLSTMREMLGKSGDPMNSVVTFGQLVQAGIAKPLSVTRPGGGGGAPPLNPGPIIPPRDEVDLTPAPQPTGFTATAGITTILVEHDQPTYTQGRGHGHSVLYGAIYPGTGPLPTFTSAVKLSEFLGSPFAYSTDPSTTFHLWLKWVTNDGVESITPAGGINGVVVNTGADVRNLLDAITAAAENPSAPFSKVSFRAGLFYIANDVTASAAPVFSVVTSPFTQNGVTVNPGVYFRDGYIMNGTITNAKIANLAVDDAKISSLSVAKLKAGSIAVGEYIQSANYIANTQGWRINGDGSAELASAIVRGTIYAASGQIGGSVIGTNFMRSSNYTPGGLGWRLDSNGTGQIGGFNIGLTQINSNNYLLGVSGWRLTKDGDFEARSGTFSGTVSASTIIASYLTNPTDTVVLDLQATGTAMFMRVGVPTNYGPYVGTRHPIEMYADGRGFFARGIVAGGTLKAAGTTTIIGNDRPAIYFDDWTGGGD